MLFQRTSQSAPPPPLLLLMIMALAVLNTVHALQMFCLIPDAGCTTLQPSGDMQDCTANGEYLGCRFEPSSSTCEEKPQCISNERTCAWKSITLEATSTMLPGCLPGGDQETCDAQRARAYKALDIAALCDGDSTPPTYTKLKTSSATAGEEGEEEQFAVEYFVDPANGVDNGNTLGTSREDAFASLEYALVRSRAALAFKAKRKRIWLLRGKHRLLNTVELNEQDTLLTIEGEPGAVLSGSQLIDRLNWQRASPAENNVLVTSLSSRLVRQLGPLSALFINGKPMTRARYPNVNVAGQSAYATIGLKNWRKRGGLTNNPIRDSKAITIVPGRYGKFYSARGGRYTGQFSPDIGYFNEPTNEAQGGCEYSIPGGVTLQGSISALLDASQWQNESQSIYFHVFHPYKWGLWTFDLTNQSSTASNNASRPLASLAMDMSLVDLRAWQNFYLQAGGDGWLVCSGAEAFFNPCAACAPALMPARGENQRVSCKRNTQTGKFEITEIVLRSNKLSGKISERAFQSLERLAKFDVSNMLEGAESVGSANMLSSDLDCLDLPSCVTGRTDCGQMLGNGLRYCTPQPTLAPTRVPTTNPTLAPTRRPTLQPTRAPTRSPTMPTTHSPSIFSYAPTYSPTFPTTQFPTKKFTSKNPTRFPTLRPTKKSKRPTLTPTRRPSRSPTRPTRTPTLFPTRMPTVPVVFSVKTPEEEALEAIVTSRPTRTTFPTKRPTRTTFPTMRPTLTARPTQSPTFPLPTKRPTLYPTKRPTNTDAPVPEPTASPITSRPSTGPTFAPPSSEPTSSAPSSAAPTVASVTLQPSNKYSTMTMTFAPTATAGPTLLSVTTKPITKKQNSLTADVDLTLSFHRGGFQEARGDCGTGGRNEWFVENSKTLLDAPGEYFLDLAESKLYLIPPAALDLDSLIKAEFELTSQRVLLRAKHTNDLRIRNLQFEHTYATHMDENTHEVPSGGDWTVTRQGALVLEGVMRVQVRFCVFRHLGGNGVFVSNFARGVEISRNDFQALGSSSVLLVGDPLHYSATAHDRRLNTMNHVEQILVKENCMSELGLVVKQSSGIFLALAKSVHMERNVIFDCARAAITFNDGFGGNHTVLENVMFHVVLETEDHGPLNVWDRQQYLEPAGKIPFKVTSNLVYGNILGPKGIDLDDGVRDWDVKNNVVLDGLLKLKGSNLNYEDNLLFPNSWGCYLLTPLNSATEANNLQLRRNTCISLTSLPPYNFNVGSKEAELICDTKNLIANANTFYGTKVNWSGCGVSSMSVAGWRNNRKQDVDSLFVANVRPPLTTQLQLILDKLDWALKKK